MSPDGRPSHQVTQDPSAWPTEVSVLLPVDLGALINPPGSKLNSFLPKLKGFTSPDSASCWLTTPSPCTDSSLIKVCHDFRWAETEKMLSGGSEGLPTRRDSPAGGLPPRRWYAHCTLPVVGSNSSNMQFVSSTCE